MKKYQPTDLIKFASRTGRWTVKKINNMPTLYTTNLGSYLRFKVSNAKKCQISVKNERRDYAIYLIFRLGKTNTSALFAAWAANL